MDKTKKPLLDFASIATALLALLIYGGWAAFVNSDHGTEMAIRAGLGQGVYAFFSTWLVTGTARKVLVNLGHNRLSYIVSFLASFCVMLTFPLIIHSLIGTIDILEAILPGLIWGSFYIVVVIKISTKTNN